MSKSPSMDDIRMEVAIEFGRNIRSEMDAEAVQRAAAVFDETVREAIESEDYAWDEGTRSFVLRHIGKIARRADALAGGASISAENLEAAKAEIFERTKAALDRALRPEPVLITICRQR